MKRKKSAAQKQANMEKNYAEMMYAKATQAANIYHLTAQNIALYNFFENIDSAILKNEQMLPQEIKYRVIALLYILSEGNTIDFFKDNCLFKINQEEIDLFMQMENPINEFFTTLVNLMEEKGIVEIIKEDLSESA